MTIWEFHWAHLPKSSYILVEWHTCHHINSMTCSSRNEQCCILEHSLVVWLLIKVYDTIIISLRHVHTMKIMHIESKLIHIISVYTNNCALTTIHIECSFDQSTSIGAVWSQFEEELHYHRNQCGCYIFTSDQLYKEIKEITSVMLLLHSGKVLYLRCHV